MLSCRMLAQRHAASLTAPTVLTALWAAPQNAQGMTAAAGSFAAEGVFLRGQPSARQLLRRAFASGQLPGEGLPRSKIRAVPFTVTPFEAKHTFDEHHAKSWLHKRPSGGDIRSGGAKMLRVSSSCTAVLPNSLYADLPTPSSVEASCLPAAQGCRR